VMRRVGENARNLLLATRLLFDRGHPRSVWSG
jgi:hypothetical protein